MKSEFVRGQRVHLSYDRNVTGIVMQPGPEVSEVQLERGNGTRYFENRLLRPDHRPRVRRSRRT